MTLATLAPDRTAFDAWPRLVDRQGRRPAAPPESMRDRAAGPVGSVLAWAAGCGAAALTVVWGQGVAVLAAGGGADALLGEVAATAPRTLTGLTAAALFLTLVPAPLLIWLARAAGWTRGRADLWIGAGLGAVLTQLFGVPLLDGPAGWTLTALMTLAGLMGGLTYWLVAGRPQTPAQGG